MALNQISLLTYLNSMSKTSFKSNLAKGYIAFLPPVMATSAFVCCMCWAVAGTFASSGRRKCRMHLCMNMLQWAGHILPQVRLPVGDLHPHLICVSLGSH